ncbi:MAG: DUF1080 domain-containing protein [Planctomycetes bacterium]|nr:DUF1080 domain-containing protein [Planctomycetota bacterium]
MSPRSLSVLFVLVLPAGLCAQSEELGKWISLFNGKDASGWTNAKSFEANAWTVADGALTQAGARSNDTSTAEQFGSYELELEYKLGRGGNSGVYLRGWIEVQILDSHPNRNAKPSGGDAGAIYGAGPPLVISSKPAGEWNKYRILHIGSRITVYHNDVLVQDNVYKADATPGSMKGSKRGDELKLDGSRGPIMLQGDHEKVWYRNVRIRRLVDPADGWRPLWNGKDLTELTARGDQRAKDGLRWKVEDHAFTNTGVGGNGHDIWTNEAFGNFLVHYEYRSGSDDRNSGFYLRDQWEIQIEGKNHLSNKHMDGDLYSIYPVAQLARNAPDQWNHMDVKVDGMKIWVWQNGKLIHDGRVCATRTDDHGVKTDKWSKAPFKLQGDHGKVAFTNLYIKPLPDSR